MPKLTEQQIDAVNCPTSTNVKTIDGATHSVVALFPKMVLPDGQNNLKGYEKAQKNWMEQCLAIASGEAIQLVNDQGEIIKTIEPTDGLPATEPEKETTTKAVLDDNGNAVIVDGVPKVEVSVNYAHGQKFSKSLPIDFSKLVDAFNDGVKNSVRYIEVQGLNKQFRIGDGKKGRAAVKMDITKL